MKANQSRSYPSKHVARTSLHLDLGRDTRHSLTPSVGVNAHERVTRADQNREPCFKCFGVGLSKCLASESRDSFLSSFGSHEVAGMHGLSQKIIVREYYGSEEIAAGTTQHRRTGSGSLGPMESVCGAAIPATNCALECALGPPVRALAP